MSAAVLLLSIFASLPDEDDLSLLDELLVLLPSEAIGGDSSPNFAAEEEWEGEGLPRCGEGPRLGLEWGTGGAVECMVGDGQ